MTAYILLINITRSLATGMRLITREIESGFRDVRSQK